MVSVEEFREIVDKYFTENALHDCFWVSAKVQAKSIEIFIDSDHGMSFGVCQKLSRHIEAILDESGKFGEDYTLEVSSPGVGTPLILVRQYKKNIGKKIEVAVIDKKFIGVLIDATDEAITVQTDEVRLEGKKKIKYKENNVVPYSNIKEATIQISFK